MRNKGLLFLIGSILMILCACVRIQQETRPDAAWPGYVGTMEGYVYCNKSERDMDWEEDLLYLADQFLTRHPALTDNESWIIRYENLDQESIYTDELYNAELRKQFLAEINSLIPRINELSDNQVLFELHRIVALLEECHSSVGQPKGERLPVDLEAIYTGERYEYFVKSTPSSRPELLYARLSAVNGVPVEELMDKFSLLIGHEYDAFVVLKVEASDYFVRKPTLEAAGAVAAEDSKVDLSLETDQGTVTVSFAFVSLETYEQMELIDGSMESRDIPMYRYSGERVIWMEELENNTLYVRVTHMSLDPDVYWTSFFAEVEMALMSSEEPMKLIIDLRDNSGGYRIVMNGLVPVIQRQKTDGVYLLINEGTMSASVIDAVQFDDMIPGLTIVGSPASQPPNFYSYLTDENELMPNSGYRFYVSEKYGIAAPGFDEPTLMPDIEVYQTLEDYKNGIDTVLGFVLELD